MKCTYIKYHRCLIIVLISILSIGCSKKSQNINLFADTIYFDFQYENLFNWSGLDCQAIAVRSNKILFMGSRVGAEQFKGPNTKIIEFRKNSQLHPIRTSNPNKNDQNVGLNSVEMELRVAKNE